MVIYVDDLDRMNPPEAVRLLELLKNIFNLPHCVFVLAIDYQVVVKGLKEKFGPRTEDNDFEFRSFFDKIIQLPFNMPINDYKIGQYVISLLKDIGFVEESWVDGNFEEHVNKFVSSTIGGNPRSIKRLINSLSLIKILISEDGEASNTKKGSLIMFAIVCLQVAFPKIYELLQEESRFWDWNEELARGVTQGKEEEEKDWVKNFTTAKKKDKKFDDASNKVKELLLDENFDDISANLELELVKIEIDRNKISFAIDNLDRISQEYRDTLVAAEANFLLSNLIK